MPDPKPPLPRPDDWRQHDAALQAALQDGQAARWQALAQYLHALPLATANHWELFRCMLLDLAALRDQATDEETDDDRPLPPHPTDTGWSPTPRGY